MISHVSGLDLRRSLDESCSLKALDMTISATCDACVLVSKWDEYLNQSADINLISSRLEYFPAKEVLQCSMLSGTYDSTKKDCRQALSSLDFQSRYARFTKIRFHVRARQYILISASILGLFHASTLPSTGNLVSAEELVNL